MYTCADFRFLFFFFTHIQLCTHQDFKYMSCIFRSYLTRPDCSAPVMAPILYCFTVTRSQRLDTCTAPSCSMWSAGVTQTALIVYALEEELAELWRLSVKRSRELLSCSVATVNGSKCRIHRFSRQTRHVV